MILVTGAAGLSGSAVVRELAGNGVPVRALVHYRAKAGALEGLRHVQIVEGDMARAETLGSALEGIARVLLISSSHPGMFRKRSEGFSHPASPPLPPAALRREGAESACSLLIKGRPRFTSALESRSLQKQICRHVRFGSKADVLQCEGDVLLYLQKRTFISAIIAT